MTPRLIALLICATLWLPAVALGAAPAGAACSAAAPFILGVFPRRNPADTDRMFAPVAEHLERRLGCPVRLVTAKDFPRFWEGVEAKRYHLVHYNQFHYIRSAGAYRVIVHNEEFGSAELAGTVFVRSGDGATSPAELRGARVVFGGGPDAMMSHIVPRYLLLQAGLGPRDYEGVYARNPPNAVLAVFYGQADAAGAGEVVPRLPSVKRLMDPDAVAALVRSEPLHHLPWAVLRDLPDTQTEAIRRALLELNDDPVGQAVLASAGLTGLHLSVDSDYDDCRAIVDAVEAVMTLD